MAQAPFTSGRREGSQEQPGFREEGLKKADENLIHPEGQKQRCMSSSFPTSPFLVEEIQELNDTATKTSQGSFRDHGRRGVTLGPENPSHALRSWLVLGTAAF